MAFGSSVVLAVISTASASAGMHYVDRNSTTPIPPYTSWPTAATNIQDAVDAAADGDTVWVTNGVYDTGGVAGHPTGSTLTNRVAIYKPITVRAVSTHASDTIIKGAGPTGDSAVRGVYMAAGATLIGFTITNGATRVSINPSEGNGGGVWAGIVSNCVIIGNEASFAGGGVCGGVLYDCTLKANIARLGGGAVYAELHGCTVTANEATQFSGGGAYECRLFDCAVVSNLASNNGGGVSECGTISNCVFAGNMADSSDGGGAYESYGSVFNSVFVGNTAGRNGGGADGCDLRNCTLTANGSGEAGGGASSSWLRNCIVYYNQAPMNPNQAGTVFSYSCTTPDPGGNGNITNAPLIVSVDSPRLLAASPCINAGTNETWMAGASDLDGVPRIVGPAVDMGAYEYPLTPAGVPGVWLRNFGLPTDGTADLLDSDGDGMDNRDEYQADTIPTNSASVLQFLAIGEQAGGTRLDWKGGRDAWQFLDVREGLASTGETWTAIYGIPPPTPLTNAVIDMGATNRALFYRIRAQR